MTVGAGDLQVRGGATHEELAAVIALVSQVERGEVLDHYDRWRQGRLKALRSVTHHAERPAQR